MALYAETRGSGPDLVLLHGWGMNSGVWSSLIPLLTARLRVTTIDLPGHGNSSFDPTRRSLAAWAEDCGIVAPDRAVWLGWSLGGLVALQGVLQAPKRIRGLVLLTATPRFVQAETWPSAMPAMTLLQFRNQLAQDPQATVGRFLSLQARGIDEARTQVRELRKRLAERPQPVPAALDVGLDLLRDSDLRSRLGEIRCRTLWLLGNRDTLVPGPVSQALARYLPAARVRVLPGAAHAPFVSHPDKVMTELECFFDSLPHRSACP